MPTFDGALGQDSVRPWVKWKRWTDRVDLRVFRLTIHHLPILTAAGAKGLFGNQKCRLHLYPFVRSWGKHIASYCLDLGATRHPPCGTPCWYGPAGSPSSGAQIFTGEEGISIWHQHQQVEVLMFQTIKSYNVRWCEMSISRTILHKCRECRCVTKAHSSTKPHMRAKPSMQMCSLIHAWHAHPHKHKDTIKNTSPFLCTNVHDPYYNTSFPNFTYIPVYTCHLYSFVLVGMEMLDITSANEPTSPSINLVEPRRVLRLESPAVGLLTRSRVWLGILDVMGFGKVDIFWHLPAMFYMLFCSLEHVTWPLHATEFAGVFVGTGFYSVSPDSLSYHCGLLVISPFSSRDTWSSMDWQGPRPQICGGPQP